MSGRPRRYAFVGTGHRAELYFAALLGDHAEAGAPVALCDSNPTRMAYYQRLWRSARPGAADLPAYGPDKVGTMLSRERPHVVVVASVDRLHAEHVTAALDQGCDVICEKPLAIDVDGCRAIVQVAERSAGELIVGFNYRYAPRNSAVKELVGGRAIGTATSVHFEWLLDTIHGADYFRRWHRDRRSSGGLLVHKSTHHFDLVNWWLTDVPETVFAHASLRFYGAANRRDPAPFAIDLAADDRLRQLYVDARADDGYERDRDPFAPGVSIEDNMAVLVSYRRGALLTYSLNAHAPWEGYRVGINGTEGRLELTVCERPAVEPGAAEQIVGWSGRRREVRPVDDVRPLGAQLVIQRHWERAERVPIEQAGAGHGGGDARLLADLFGATEPAADPLERRAGYGDGVRSVLTGIAANQSVASGHAVALAELGVALDEVVR
jgi:predicted dehydrogenase